MRFATSFDGENLHEVKITNTPQDFEEAMELIKDYILRSDSVGKDKVACLGLPGVLDKEKSVLISAPNLPDWVTKPVQKRISEFFQGAIYLENDASLAGLGEAVKGAGRGFSVVAFVSVGTGIGGARIVNQKIDISSFGFEPGHQIIDADGSMVGKPIDLEGLVAGAGLESRFNKSPEEISDERIWSEVERLLAVGLTNTILHWSPQVLVLGGGMMLSPHLTIEGIKYHLREFLKVFPVLPEVKKGELGDEAGLYGALVYIKQFQNQI